MLTPQKTRWRRRDRRKWPDGRTAKVPNYNKHRFPARIPTTGPQPALQVAISASWLHSWWKESPNRRKTKALSHPMGSGQKCMGRKPHCGVSDLFCLHSTECSSTAHMLGAVSLTTGAANSTYSLKTRLYICCLNPLHVRTETLFFMLQKNANTAQLVHFESSETIQLRMKTKETFQSEDCGCLRHGDRGCV